MANSITAWVLSMAASMPAFWRISVTLSHSSTLPTYWPASSTTELMRREKRRSPMVISAVCGTFRGADSSTR